MRTILIAKPRVRHSNLVELRDKSCWIKKHGNLNYYDCNHQKIKNNSNILITRFS